MRTISPCLNCHLKGLYGETRAQVLFDWANALIEELPQLDAGDQGFSHREVFLKIRPSVLSGDNPKALAALNQFAQTHINNVFSGLHLTPVHPASNNNAFSIKDHRTVDPNLGTWEEISALGNQFQLTMDAVVNHVSGEHPWFDRYLKGDSDYMDYFLEMPKDFDLSKVICENPGDLLRKVDAADGERWVWSTFGSDAVDLNFDSTRVMQEAVQIVLNYALKGAKMIHVNHIAHLWKEPGTSCYDLPQAHFVLRYFRAILDRIAPGVALSVDANLPYEEWVTYFGDGFNEAQYVYNATLAPLALYSVMTGNTNKLCEWASGVRLPSMETTFVNSLSFDEGIALNGARGILTDTEMDVLVQQTVEQRGLAVFNRSKDGIERPAWLKIKAFDLLSNPEDGQLSIDLAVKRYLAVQAILLSFVGIAEIDFSELFLEENKSRLGEKHVHPNAVSIMALSEAWEEETSILSKMMKGIEPLVKARTSSSAFDPHAPQMPVKTPKCVFGCVRFSLDMTETVICLQNVSSETQILDVDLSQFSMGENKWEDMLSKQSYAPDELPRGLSPYQTIWLRMTIN
jgi:sucrose phosphorylase